MAGKRRNPEEIELLNREALLHRIRGMEGARDRAMVAFLYMTGMRISELLGTIKVIKNKAQDGEVHTRRVFIEPLKKESIEVLEDKGIVLVHQVSCLKRRNRIPKRTIPIKMETERDFLEIFLSYYRTLPPEEYLFYMTRQRAWQIIRKGLGLFSHYLIHQRSTYLVTHRNFTDMDLKQFRGWADTRPASVYTHLKWGDIAKKM